MSHCATWSGTYCSFASDEPCALYLTHLYLPFNPDNLRYKFPPEFRLRKSIQPDHFTPFYPMCICPPLPLTFAMLHLLCRASHHIALPCSPTVLTHYKLIAITFGDYPLPPDHTLRATLGSHFDCLLHPILAMPLAYYWSGII